MTDGVRLAPMTAALPTFAHVTAQPRVERNVAVEPLAGRATVRGTRPADQVVNARRSVVRDHRVVARPGLAETRIFNPVLADRLHDIRFPPILFAPDCPAGGGHAQTASADYTLVVNRPGAQGQTNWRWCRKCQGLAYGGHVGGVCIKGGTHDFSISADYVLPANVALAGHQSNWKWCGKCDGLAFAGQPSLCAAGGAHDHTGSWDYALAINQPDAEGQPNWRWCSNCMTLAYAGGATGATREELGLPVASSDPVVDHAAFEAPAGPERFHLPRYHLSRRLVDGSLQYLISLSTDESGRSSLSVTLDKVRPEGVPEDTAELPHDLLLRLSFSLTMSGGGSATKTLDFADVLTNDDDQVVARIRFASPAERDQVLAAITNSDSGCGIVALRAVRVAVPIAGHEGRYRPVTRGLEQKVEPDPLFLHPDLHPYLHGGARPAGGSSPGLVTRQLQFGGRFHKYWEDATNPTRVFYLPDAFRLARVDKPPPYKPLMKVRQVDGPTRDADPQVAIDFVATPWTDLKRLEAARAELAKSLPADAGGAAAESRMRMEPLPVHDAAFWLALPGGAGGGLVERPNANVDLNLAVVCSETLSRTDFTTVFDALMGGGLAIMRGEVRVDFGQGATERIPFEARFDRMNGDVLEAEVTEGAKPGQFSLRLRNAIESPLLIERLGASILAGQTELAAVLTPSSPLPLILPPGESMNVAIEASGGVPADLAGETLEPLIDVDGVHAQPNRELLIAAIIDDTATVEAGRTITLKLFPAMFDAPSGDPAEKALAIIVHFQHGMAVELTPDSLERQVRIASSLKDILLPGSAMDGFRYKTEVIRRSSRPVHPDWQTASSNLLVPLLPSE